MLVAHGAFLDYNLVTYWLSRCLYWNTLTRVNSIASMSLTLITSRVSWATKLVTLGNHIWKVTLTSSSLSISTYELHCLIVSVCVDLHKIALQFNQSVRIRSIVIHTADAPHAPKTIKLAINRPALGFEDVESAAEPEMAQVFEELSPDDIANSRRIALRYVRFQSVTSLHVCFMSSYEFTRAHLSRRFLLRPTMAVRMKHGSMRLMSLASLWRQPRCPDFDNRKNKHSTRAGASPPPVL